MAKKSKHPADSRSFVMLFSEALVRLMASDVQVSVPWLLIDFLARKKSGATIYIDKVLHEDFNAYLEAHASQHGGGEIRAVSASHFRHSCYKLRDAGIIIPLQGHAFTLNPKCAWRGSTKFMYSKIDDLNRKQVLPESPSATALRDDEGDPTESQYP